MNQRKNGVRSFGRTVLVFVCLSLGLPAGPVGASEHAPSAPDTAVDFSTHLRVFLRADNWNPMVSVDVQSAHGLEQVQRSLTLGSYYRLHRNWKIGAFYRLQQAVHHDDDWKSVDDSDGFTWRETGERTEHVLLVDVSPRFLLPWLPGEDWVFMLKSRFGYNTFNDHQWLQLRPGLTYFHIVDRRPRFNASLQWDFYVPFNFGEAPLYAHWPYLNVLYHLTPTVKLDASVAHRFVTWSTSADVADDPAHGDYTRTIRSWMVGLGLVVQLES